DFAVREGVPELRFGHDRGVRRALAAAKAEIRGLAVRVERAPRCAAMFRTGRARGGSADQRARGRTFLARYFARDPLAQISAHVEHVEARGAVFRVAGAARVPVRSALVHVAFRTFARALSFELGAEPLAMLGARAFGFFARDV